MKLGFSGQNFEKYLNIKFNENPSEKAEFFYADRRRDMTKLIVAFRNFSNTPREIEET